MKPRSRGLRTLVAVCVALVSAGAAMRGSAAAAEHAPGAPTDLRVDEAVAPLWVTGAPTFGWLPTDADRNEVQTAYRIVVSTPPRTPGKPSPTVWDSGRVSSGAESYVAAPGLRLQPDRTYTWMVQTWDRAGRSGPFARAASFGTALGDRDWDADWIRRSVPPTNPFEDYFLVRRAFSTGDVPIVRARAYVAASQQYQLYVDGLRVDTGPSYSYPGEQYYEAIDIAKYLTSGRRHVIAMIVHNLGAGQGRPSEPPGLIAHISIDHENGGRQTLTTNANWLWHPGPWLASGPRNGEGDFVESIDARRIPPDWASSALDARRWAHVAVVGPHPTEPWTHLVAQRTRITEEPVKPVSFRKLPSGSYVVDFGSVIAATPAITLHAGRAGRHLTLLQGFLLDADGSVSTAHGTQATDMHDEYTERDGAQTLRPFGYLGFRYLELVNAQEPLRAADFVAYARHAEMPDLQASTFSSSSPILDRVWALAQHSALYGSQEQFLDTPTRERAQFLRDAANSSSVTTMAFAERNLTWQALRDFARSQQHFWPDGRVNALYPNGDGKRDIPDFTEDYAGWVMRNYETTGDRATLADLYPVIANIARYVGHAILPTTGLVTNLPGGGGDYQGGIVDWPIQMRYGYDMTTTARTTENILGIEVFRAVADAARVLHRPAAEAHAALARAAALTKAVNAQLRRPDGVYIDGLHRDGKPSAHASQQANAYALAAGIAPDSNRVAVANFVMRLGMATGPDIAGVVLDALHASGHDQALVDLVSNANVPGWAQILARGATFTWESWNARDVPGDSESHPWGSTVLPALTNFVLGTRVSAAGASRVDIAPPHTTVTHASGRLATERGAVKVTWRRGDATHFTLAVTVPDNVVATVRLPAATARNVREGRQKIAAVGGVTVDAVGGGVVRLSVGSGDYSFAVAPAPPEPARRSSTPLVMIAVVVLLAIAAVLFVVRRRRVHERGVTSAA